MAQPGASPTLDVRIVWERARCAGEALKTLFDESSSEFNMRRCSLLLLELRHLNRIVCQHIKERKRKVQAAKNVFDRAELARQNLLYEKNYLVTIIEDTKRHPELFRTVNLMDETLFDERHPMKTELDAHSKILARLADELEQRKAMTEELKLNQESLELARSRLALKKKELERIRDQFSNIFKTGEVLLSSYARFSHERMSEERKETLLPLKTLYERLQGTNEKFKARLLGEVEQHKESLEDGEEEGSISMERSEETEKSHGRFVSQTQKANTHRHHAFAHLVYEYTATRCGFALCFYHAIRDDASTPIVVDVHVDGVKLEMAQIESLLLSCKLAPYLLLTVPHESITVGESGFVAFRWVQVAAGMLSDPSYTDTHSIIGVFCDAVTAEILSLQMGEKMSVDEPV